MVRRSFRLSSIENRRFPLLWAVLFAGLISVHNRTPTAASASSATEMQAAGWYGISPNHFQQFYRAQQKYTWCWAACIEMVLDYYGPNVNQNAIVRQVYGANWNGEAPDAPASFTHVQQLLNQWGIDDDGDRFWVQATGGMGAPPPAWLFGEVTNGFPIITLFFPFGTQMGHFVVITGVYFDGLNVLRLHIWDPYPYHLVGMQRPWYYTPIAGNPGCFDVPAPAFMSTVAYHIYSRAVEDRGFTWPHY